MNAPAVAQRRAPAGERIAATLSRRQHVESLSMLALLLVIQSLIELHTSYGTLGFITVITVGIRDMLIVLLFAEEEGFIK